jgi:hypothetical protein
VELEDEARTAADRDGSRRDLGPATAALAQQWRRREKHKIWSTGSNSSRRRRRLLRKKEGKQQRPAADPLDRRRRRKLPTQILVGSGSRPPGAGSLLQLRLPSP